MKLTRRKAIELFREHWRWAGKTGKYKKEWPGLHGEYIENDCFLCEYDNQHKGSYCCNTCLIIWPSEDGSCEGSGSPYDKWGAATTPRTRKKWAKVIAELPERTKPCR